MMLGGDDLKGRAAGNSGQYTVSPAPDVDAGESGSRRGWTDPRPNHFVPRLDVMPIPFAEFYAAVFGGRGLMSGRDWW